MFPDPNSPRSRAIYRKASRLDRKGFPAAASSIVAVVYHATDEPWNRREQFVASRQKLRTRNMRASARVLIKDFRSGRLTAQQVLDIFGMDEADILPPPDASDRIFEYGKQRNVHLLY